MHGPYLVQHLEIREVNACPEWGGFLYMEVLIRRGATRHDHFLTTSIIISGRSKASPHTKGNDCRSIPKVCSRSSLLQSLVKRVFLIALKWCVWVNMSSLFRDSSCSTCTACACTVLNAYLMFHILYTLW